jgi:2-amino-4-hydroxy-6-hydroxymethyldihydropteridine diphosphokinase
MPKAETAYIQLGGNTPGTADWFFRCVSEEIPQWGTIQALSSCYETEPWGFNSPDRFLNAVLSVQTDLSPEKLMQTLLQIEHKAGRTRNTDGRYESRILDLDVLALGEQIVNKKSIILPHPRLHLRNFVLQPFSQIAPQWVHPIFGKTTVELLAGCTDPSEIKRLTNQYAALAIFGG